MTSDEIATVLQDFEGHVLRNQIRICLKALRLFMSQTGDIDHQLYKDLLLIGSNFENIENSFSQGVISFGDYDLHRSKLIRALIELKNKIKNENFLSFPVLKPKGFSNDLLNEFKAMGIDLLILSEMKRMKGKGAEVDKTIHKSIINGRDLTQEIFLEGKNISGKKLTTFYFQADGSKPTSFKDMAVSAEDLINGDTLICSTKDADDNISKIIAIHLKTPILNGGRFSLMYRFTLKNTIKMNGKDFINSFLAFEGIVNSYTAVIEFVDAAPEFIKVVDLRPKAEHILYPKDNVFQCEIENLEHPSLNHLRRIYYFER